MKPRAEKLIPTEQASEHERRAIEEEPDDIASEEELLGALRGRNVHR